MTSLHDKSHCYQALRGRPGCCPTVYAWPPISRLATQRHSRLRPAGEYGLQLGLPAGRRARLAGGRPRPARPGGSHLMIERRSGLAQADSDSQGRRPRARPGQLRQHEPTGLLSPSRSWPESPGLGERPLAGDAFPRLRCIAVIRTARAGPVRTPEPCS
jgi:hypothetical protein